MTKGQIDLSIKVFHEKNWRQNSREKHMGKLNIYPNISYKNLC